MTGITAAARELANVLREETGLCNELLVITDREQEAIVASNVEVLTALIDEKERLLELLATLETERMTALTAVADAIGQPAGGLTLSIVAESATAEVRAHLVDVGEELRASGIALARANERNARLLEASSELVDRWMQYLKTVISNALTYSQDGNTQGPTGNRVFDRSA